MSTSATEVDSTEGLSSSGHAFRFGFPDDTRLRRELPVLWALVGVVLVPVLELWDFRWRAPQVNQSDGTLVNGIVTSVEDNGWHVTTNRLGAPFGADWSDFPRGGENVHWFTMKVIGWFTDSAPLIVNTFFVLSFFTVATTAYLVARYLGLRVSSALTVAVLFDFLQFHIVRVVQVPRTAYFMVPIGVLLILWVLGWKSAFLRDGERSFDAKRAGVAIGLCIVLGGTDSQVAGFTAALLAVIAVVAVIRWRDWRPGAVALGMVMLIGASLTLNNLPYLLQVRAEGANTAVANRLPEEQQRFGLEIWQLLAPVSNHRIDTVAEFRDDLRSESLGLGEGSGSQSLGLIGSVGFATSVLVLLATAVGGVADRRRDLSAKLSELGMLNVVAVFLATVGGLSFLTSSFGLASYRTWNRMSLFIAFASLVAIGLMIDAIGDRIRVMGRRQVLGGAAALSLVTAAGVYDQTPTTILDVRDFHAFRWDRDAEFFGQVEAGLAPGAQVFEYPVVEFPESLPPTRAVTDYELLKPYIHTDELRWSHGAMKGRSEFAWQTELLELGPDAQVGALAAAGFDAVFVHRRAVPPAQAELEPALARILGQPLLESSDGVLVVYDLAPLREQLVSAFGAPGVEALGRTVLAPQAVTYGEGAHQAERAPDGTRFRWGQDQTRLHVDLRAEEEPAVLHTTLVTNGPARIDLELPGRDPLVIESPGSVEVVEPFAAGVDGVVEIVIRTDAARTVGAGDPRDLRVQIVDLRVTRGEAVSLAGLREWAASVSP